MGCMMPGAVIVVRKSAVVGNGAPRDGAILRQSYKGRMASGCLLNLSQTRCSLYSVSPSERSWPRSGDSPEGQLASYRDKMDVWQGGRRWGVGAPADSNC